VIEMSFLDYATIVSYKVDQFIYSIISGEPAELYEASLHYIKAGGKRLRPLITILASRIVGGNEETAIPGAAAVEVLHTFTLVHDDIIDKDELRRGVPTVHRLWGIDMAIVAGDTLYAYAYKCLLQALSYGTSSDRVSKAIEYLTEAAITVAEGQALDMLLPSRSTVSESDYINMVKKKTATLFAASAAIGAALAGGSDDVISKLWNIMIMAGIAFQIRDDVLGLIGDERTLGKPVYSDLREGKMTILVIYALNRADEKYRNKMKFVIGNRAATHEELAEVAELIKNLGALEHAEAIADEYAEKTIALVELLNSVDSEALLMMKDVVRFMVRRNY